MQARFFRNGNQVINQNEIINPQNVIIADNANLMQLLGMLGVDIEVENRRALLNILINPDQAAINNEAQRAMDENALPPFQP